MAEESVTLKLTAILTAAVKAYSGLVAEDFHRVRKGVNG